MGKISDFDGGLMEQQAKGGSKMAITDLHCHLLPGLDDGAKTPEIALDMAMMAAAAGVRQIVCTPHCTAGDPGIRQRIVKIRKFVEVFNHVLSEKQLPVSLYAGMELFCNGNLSEALERREFLTLAGSMYLLIEFPFEEPLSRIEWAANMVRQSGYIPVLAHPERYHAVWRNPDCLAFWFRSGYVVQLDKDSVLGRFGKHCAHMADWALRHGLAHIVASDAHDSRIRTTDLSVVRQFMEKKYSPDYADLLLSRNPARILKNAPLVEAG